METTTSTKGQIIIPARMRRKLGIKPGTPIKIELDEENRRLILTPVTPDYVNSLLGKYQGKGLLEALVVEKERERKE